MFPLALVAACTDSPGTPTTLAELKSQYSDLSLTLEPSYSGEPWRLDLDIKVPAIWYQAPDANPDRCPGFPDGLEWRLNGTIIDTSFGGGGYSGDDAVCNRLGVTAIAANENTFDLQVSDGHDTWQLVTADIFNYDFEVDAAAPSHIVWKSSQGIEWARIDYVDSEGHVQRDHVAQVQGNTIIAPTPTIIQVSAQDHPSATCNGAPSCKTTRRGGHEF